MGKHDDTRPMKRLPDSPPRISYRIRFWIFMGTGMDLALIGLAAVLYLTPIHPNYPAQQVPVQSPQTPTIGSVYLPMGTTPPPKATRTAVTTRQSHPATHPHTTAPKPPVVPSTPAKSSTAPTPTVTLKSASSTPTPTDQGN